MTLTEERQEKAAKDLESAAWFNSLTAKSVLAGEKLVATYSIST
jgi:hypothetical protein